MTFTDDDLTYFKKQGERRLVMARISMDTLQALLARLEAAEESHSLLLQAIECGEDDCWERYYEKVEAWLKSSGKAGV